MSMNTRAEILQMVADGVITQEEADRLIDALGASGQGQSDPPADGKLEAPENWQENGLCTETEEPCQNIRVEVDVGGLKLLPSWDGKLRSEVKMHSMGDRLTNYSYGVETRLGETYLYLKRKMFRPWGRNGGATLGVYVPSGMQRVNCKVTVGGCQVEKYYCGGAAYPHRYRRNQVNRCADEEDEDNHFHRGNRLWPGEPGGQPTGAKSGGGGCIGISIFGSGLSSVL